MGHDNCVLKYADDVSLLVPENSYVSAASEMAHIISWSESNKLKINLAKCTELVFKRPNVKQEISPSTLPDVIRVNSVKLLGVYLDHEHVEQIARITSHRRSRGCTGCTCTPPLQGRETSSLVAQLSQRERAASWVSYGQKWKTGTGRQYLRIL